MHRYNNVRLEGPITVAATNETDLGHSTQIPNVEFFVTTDLDEIGGCHPISAYGQLALEVLAFSLVWHDTNPGEELHVSVLGRLLSIDGTVRVIAERAVFYVHPDVRKVAVEQLEKLKQRYKGTL
jgi:hypothetical protein